MRPTIVCHMMSSIDGRLNGDRWSEPFDGKNRDILFAPYYTISERLSPEAHMLGRNTVQIHFCPKTFDHTGLPRAVRPEPYLALSPAPRKLVILDPHGKIFYDTNTIMDSGIIAVLGENVSEAYLTHLRENDISYLFAGADGHDLENAMEQIGTLFSIERIVLEGGGIVNGQFLKHGLIDEFSLMIYPGIDGLARIHSIVEYTGNDDVWLKKQLEAQHVTRIGDVFLATVNAQNELAVYPRTGERVAHEMFE